MTEIEVRRATMKVLAESVRALGDAAAQTAIDLDECREIAGELDGLRERLAREVHEDPYSGLQDKPPDFSAPEGPMPLSPIIGSCSPVRPDVTLAFHKKRVAGRARFTRRFVGPPGFVHGGISALLADQLVAVAPLARGMGCVTRDMRVRYRRALPLEEEVELVGWCTDLEDDRAEAGAEIRVRGEVAVEATANLRSYRSLAKKHGTGRK